MTGRVDAGVDAELEREHLGADPVAVVHEVGVALGERHGDAVGELEALLLAHDVELVDEVVDAALGAQLVVELDVERDADAVVLGDRPALEVHRLAADDVVGAELLARDEQAAAVERRRTSPAFSAARTAGSFLPSRGPRTRRFGRISARATGPSSNATSLTRSSSAISSACDADSGAPRT